MIYMIPEEEEPISSCVLELESTFNPNSNSNNNDDKNNSSSSIQNGNKNYDNSDSNSNPETYITLFDLFKEQELKWFSNNNKNIMPECVHDTDARFDLRYPEEGIIDAGYVGNIIAMLQNDSKKTYVIEPNKKIAQAIFLFLVKIVQLVLVGNKEELGIMARGIQGFGSTDRIDVPVNMAEEKIINKREIISTRQPISILPYDQYMVAIERKVKNQIQIFEAEATLCESGGIGLVNLYIPAKNHSYIKIPIYNNTGDIIKIPAETTIRYLTTEIEDQFPNTIPDFSQLCKYVDITLQTIYG
ncbi:hypothetical protein G9A89_001128 [Geosiphon pyriformis]|nr:hypothetical protein G9A89_001128 [Geosiphon pyriformis]